MVLERKYTLLMTNHHASASLYLTDRQLRSLAKKGIRIKDTTPFKDNTVTFHCEDAKGAWQENVTIFKPIDLTNAMPVPEAVLR